MDQCHNGKPKSSGLVLFKMSYNKFGDYTETLTKNKIA